jgi:hypothetical protein
MGIAATERMDLLDCLGAAFATDRTSLSAGVGSAGQQFLDLVDVSTTFPKVWGLMGPNISLYHTQVSVQPPLPPGTQRERFGWHRDSGNLNKEVEGNAAMVSLKVGFFLTDAAESTGFHCVPGSHLPLSNGQFEQPPRDKDPPSAVSVSMEAGDAIVPLRTMRFQLFRNFLARILNLYWDSLGLRNDTISGGSNFVFAD